MSDIKETDFEQTQLKYYRYIKYLISHTDFELPEGLVSPVEVIDMRVKGNLYPIDALDLNKSYFEFISQFGFSKLENNVAFSIMLATYATSMPNKSTDELDEAIDQLDSYFSKVLKFHSFEDE